MDGWVGGWVCNRAFGVNLCVRLRLRACHIYKGNVYITFRRLSVYIAIAKRQRLCTPGASAAGLMIRTVILIIRTVILVIRTLILWKCRGFGCVAFDAARSSSERCSAEVILSGLMRKHAMLCACLRVCVCMCVRACI